MASLANDKTVFHSAYFLSRRKTFWKASLDQAHFTKFPTSVEKVSLSKKSCTYSIFSVDSKNYLPVSILIMVFKIIEKRANTGLSMNILCAGNKSVMQRDLFKNSAGDLLPTLRFLSGLYNLHHFVILFSLM